MGDCGGTMPATTFPRPVSSDTRAAEPAGVTVPELLRQRRALHPTSGMLRPEPPFTEAESRITIRFGAVMADDRTTIDRRRRAPDVEAESEPDERSRGPRVRFSTEPSAPSNTEASCSEELPRDPGGKA